MKYNFVPRDTVAYFEKIVNVPSPVGYYVQMNPVISRLAEELGETVWYDNKSTAYITLEGEDNSKTVLVGAHLDTIGMVVRCIDSNGMIRVRQLGGINYGSAEGETVTVHTPDGELTLRLRDILYLEGEGNYYTVRTATGESFRCRSTLSAAEELVAGYDFFRIHQGYLGNLEHIRAVGDDGALRMDNGATLYVSRRKLTAFREAYMQFTRRRLTR